MKVFWCTEVPVGVRSLCTGPHVAVYESRVLRHYCFAPSRPHTVGGDGKWGKRSQGGKKEVEKVYEKKGPTKGRNRRRKSKKGDNNLDKVGRTIRSSI